MKPAELVDEALKKLGSTKRRDLEKVSGINERRLSDFAKNERWPDNNQARLLAEAAGLNPFVVIAELEISRAEDESTKTAWSKTLASLTGKAVAVSLALFVAVTALTMTLPSPAGLVGSSPVVNQQSAIIFIM